MSGPNVNHFVGVGRLTRDPERNGPALKFAIAINRFGKDAGADFIDCVVFEKLAETMSTMLAKGGQVMVEGRLKQSTWTPEGGGKRSKLEVVAYNIQLLDRPKRAESDDEQESESAEDSQGGNDGDDW